MIFGRIKRRTKWIKAIFYFFFIAIILKLFYLQFYSYNSLTNKALTPTYYYNTNSSSSYLPIPLFFIFFFAMVTFIGFTINIQAEASIKKIEEDPDEIRDALRQGHIAYVINTRDIESSGQLTDGFKIRSYAAENNVTIFTPLDTVRVLLDVLEETTLTISTIDS